MRQLSGGVNVSRDPHSAYTSSRMLSGPSLKIGDTDHAINRELSMRDYKPQGTYSHPDDQGQKSFSVWMQHQRGRHGQLRNYPSDEGGQFHVEHSTTTGHPTGSWYYLHNPENHTMQGSPAHFGTPPEEHGSLEHVENISDYSHHDAINDHTSGTSYWDSKVHHEKSAGGLAHFADEIGELHSDNAHTGGRYASSEEEALRHHGWEEAYHDNHAHHESYEFASDPKTIYNNSGRSRDCDHEDDSPNLQDHELHLHASGRWEHYNHNGYKVASSDDGGELTHYLRHGIKDALGASVHDQDDEEEDFPDHE
jgi:hypothetical protein